VLATLSSSLTCISGSELCHIHQIDCVLFAAEISLSAGCAAATINYWLAVLREEGWIRALESEYFVHGSACGAQPVKSGKDIVINVDSMLGIFLLLLAISVGIVCVFITHLVQHRAFLRLVFSRIDQDKTGTLTEEEIRRMLIVMGFTADATPEDPKTLQEHMDDMTSHTPEPGVRFKEFSMWWESQPYYVRQNIFKTWRMKEHSEEDHQRHLTDNPLGDEVEDEAAGPNDDFGTNDGVLDLGVGRNLTSVLEATEA
jgi:hypothetical protein